MSTIPDRNPEQHLIQRLSRIDLGRGPVKIEPISGGITNRNFVVRSGDPAVSYVARLSEPRPLLGIDRRNEVTCHEVAAASGLAPRSSIMSLVS